MERGIENSMVILTEEVQENGLKVRMFIGVL